MKVYLVHADRKLIVHSTCGCYTCNDVYFEIAGCSHRVHSFKWVESPNHGKGGPRWVEVRTC